MLSSPLLYDRPGLLEALARHSIDLTEKQCMRLVLAAVTGIPPSQVTATEAPSTAKKVSKSSKKAKAAAAEEEARQQHGMEGVNAFRRVVHAILARRGGLDASVLGETLRGLPVLAASVLLKVLAMALQGTCSFTGGPVEEDVAIELNDVSLRNALTWVEALLEAHFHAVVMGATSPTHCMYGAVATLLKVSRGVDPAVDLTESALGLCTHIHRMNKHRALGGALLTASDSQSWGGAGSSSGVYQLSVVHF